MDVHPGPVEGFSSLSRPLLTPPQSFVFIQLHTLSFSGSQLSRVLPAVCALFRKKPGVHPSMVKPGSAGILPARTANGMLAGRMPALPAHGAGWASPSPTKTANHRPRFSSSLAAAHRPLATSLISFISPAYGHRPRMSLVSPICAKAGGCTPTRKCRRADIFDFSPYILHFSCSERGAKGSSPRARLRRRPLQNRRRRPKAAPTKKAGHGSRSRGSRYSLPATGHRSRINLHRLALSLAEGSLATGH